MKKNCLNCDQIFNARAERVRIGMGKYCSRKCYAAHHPTLGGRGRAGTMLERMEKYIDKSGGPDACWPWTYTKNKKTGYGVIWDEIKKRVIGVHRASYLLAHNLDDLPSNIEVCHHCDNPPCCNPKHLFQGTSKDNTIDASKKGRKPRGEKNGFAKYTNIQIIEVRRLKEKEYTIKEISRKTGIPSSTVRKITARSTWKHVC